MLAWLLCPSLGVEPPLSEPLPLLRSEPEVESEPPAEPESEAEPEVESLPEPVTGLFSEPEPSAPGLPPAGVVPSPLLALWLDVSPAPEGEPVFWAVPSPLSFPDCWPVVLFGSVPLFAVPVPALAPVLAPLPVLEPVPEPAPVWELASWPVLPPSPEEVPGLLPGARGSGVLMTTVCSTVFGAVVPWASCTGTKLKEPSLLEAFQKIRSKSSREMTWPTTISSPFSRVIRPWAPPEFLPRMAVMRMNAGVSLVLLLLKTLAPMALFSLAP